MSHTDSLHGLLLCAQTDIFRLAKFEYGLDQKTISHRSGIPLPSIKYYAGGHGAMPILALLKLIGVIPDCLLSRLLAPADRCVTPCATGDDDFDTDAIESGEFLSEYSKARHPNSPGGVDIVDSEAQLLQFKRPRGKAA